MNLKFDIQKLTDEWNKKEINHHNPAFAPDILTPEQMSDKIQRHAFSLGFEWCHSLGVWYLDSPYLTLSIIGESHTIDDGDCEAWFKHVCDYKEATLDFFDTKQEPKEEPKILGARPTCTIFDDPIAYPDIILETKKAWKNRRLEAIIRFTRKRLDGKMPLPKSVIRQYNELTKKR